MAKIVTAPEPLVWDGRLPSIFLAGSIEMGTAVNWQQHVITQLADLDVLFLNPRRAEWNASWEQRLHNEPFRQQVEWELEALDRCTCILMHFEPQTKSPITLLELGLHARSGKLFVSCPDGFWRKGNIEVTCQYHGIPLFADLDGAVQKVRETITYP